MIAERYGIRLETLNENFLEQAREWRNAEHVRWNMSHMDIVSPEEHRQWFERISNSNNLYFVFSYQEKEVGMVNLKDIDWMQKTAEAGILTGDAGYLGSMVPYMTVLAMMDLAFYFFGLRSLRAKVEKKNTVAVAFNKSLGYQPVQENQEQPGYRYYEVNEERYAIATQSLRKAVTKMAGNKTVIYTTGDRDFLMPFIQVADKEKIGLTVEK